MLNNPSSLFNKGNAQSNTNPNQTPGSLFANLPQKKDKSTRSANDPNGKECRLFSAPSPNMTSINQNKQKEETNPTASNIKQNFSNPFILKGTSNSLFGNNPASNVFNNSSHQENNTITTNTNIFKNQKNESNSTFGNLFQNTLTNPENSNLSLIQNQNKQTQNKKINNQLGMCAPTNPTTNNSKQLFENKDNQPSGNSTNLFGNNSNTFQKASLFKNSTNNEGKSLSQNKQSPLFGQDKQKNSLFGNNLSKSDNQSSFTLNSNQGCVPFSKNNTSNNLTDQKKTLETKESERNVLQSKTTYQKNGQPQINNNNKFINNKSQYIQKQEVSKTRGLKQQNDSQKLNSLTEVIKSSTVKINQRQLDKQSSQEQNKLKSSESQIQVEKLISNVQQVSQNKRILEEKRKKLFDYLKQEKLKKQSTALINLKDKYYNNRISFLKRKKQQIEKQNLQLKHKFHQYDSQIKQMEIKLQQFQIKDKFKKQLIEKIQNNETYENSDNKKFLPTSQQQIPRQLDTYLEVIKDHYSKFNIKNKSSKQQKNEEKIQGIQNQNRQQQANPQQQLGQLCFLYDGKCAQLLGLQKQYKEIKGQNANTLKKIYKYRFQRVNSGQCHKEEAKGINMNGTQRKSRIEYLQETEAERKQEILKVRRENKKLQERYQRLKGELMRLSKVESKNVGGSSIIMKSMIF